MTVEVWFYYCTGVVDVSDRWSWMWGGVGERVQV